MLSRHRDREPHQHDHHPHRAGKPAHQGEGSVEGRRAVGMTYINIETWDPSTDIQFARPQKKHEKVERAVTDLRKKLEVAEREMFEIEGNPYFMKFEDVNALRQEIQDLAVFATEVTKILSDRQHGQRGARNLTFSTIDGENSRIKKMSQIRASGRR